MRENKRPLKRKYRVLVKPHVAHAKIHATVRVPVARVIATPAITTVEAHVIVAIRVIRTHVLLVAVILLVAKVTLVEKAPAVAETPVTKARAILVTVAPVALVDAEMPALGIHAALVIAGILVALVAPVTVEMPVGKVPVEMLVTTRVERTHVVPAALAEVDAPKNKHLRSYIHLLDLSSRRVASLPLQTSFALLFNSVSQSLKPLAL